MSDLSGEHEPLWIIQLEGSPDPQHFGPFASEDEALGWGFDNLADFEPEEWEPYELSLKAPMSGDTNG